MVYTKNLNVCAGDAWGYLLACVGAAVSGTADSSLIVSVLFCSASM